MFVFLKSDTPFSFISRLSDTALKTNCTPNKAIYVALGIDLTGRKDVLGLWMSENEGSKFWLNNLTEMRNRGMQDILMACTDNLKGMSEAISVVFSISYNILFIGILYNILVFYLFFQFISPKSFSHSTLDL